MTSPLFALQRDGALPCLSITRRPFTDHGARIGHYNVETRLQLDLDVNASGELQAHQSLDRLVGRLQNVDQTLVRAGLELLTAVLVPVDSAQDRDDLLVGGQRDRAGKRERQCA